MSQANFLQVLEYDDRVVKLALEYAIILTPSLPFNATKESVRHLAERLAILGIKRIKGFQESKEVIKCHTCKCDTKPGSRVMVVVCQSCEFKAFALNSEG
jgi:hypothetical protein